MVANPCPDEGTNLVDRGCSRQVSPIVTQSANAWHAGGKLLAGVQWLNGVFAELAYSVSGEVKRHKGATINLSIGARF